MGQRRMQPGGGCDRSRVVTVVLTHQHAQHVVDVLVRLCGGHAGPDPPQDLGEQRHRVVALARRRCVTCLPQRDDPHRERPAVADGQRHDHTPVGQLQTHALALVECEVGPDVGSLLQQPAHAHVGGAVLLVGNSEEPQVTARPEPRPRETREGHSPGCDLVLHVDGAAAEEIAVVVDDRVERWVRPVPGITRHDVGVAHECQGGSGATAAQPGDEVRPQRVARHDLALDPGRLEIVPEEHRSGRLAAGRVGGVDLDQGAAEVDDLAVIADGAGPRSCHD